MKKICQFITRYMALIVLLVAVAAFLWPQVLGVIRTSWVSTLLGLVMFGMGLTLNLGDFKAVFTHPREVFIGCLAQFTIMPLLAWLLTLIFQLSPELAVGVVLVGCCPGGTSSNVITYLAGGDLSLSVAMTGVSTLLAPVMTPFLTWLLVGATIPVAMLPMFMSILQVVILPIVLGLLIKHWLPRTTQMVVGYLPAFSTMVITMIVAAVVSANAPQLHTSGLVIMLVVMLHNLCGYALGFTLGKVLGLPKPKCTAISVEVGMQNSGLACSLAHQHFATLAMASVPGALFSVWHNISGALLARMPFIRSQK